ncbi:MULTISPECIES: efflux RND transporter periplasmic adaptor subunit [unclassified Pseudoalteromonas]|uniref:efflux RND transporter periplasmic adaptor subunit n=1 Tax=unclassified Pseudoalteromonas TaxID=194690 RepID=UPI0007302239|nr:MULTISPECIES: efflux RND transporter periplasmic adaptor subunit [unclassified Pseudoalteromonas]KTD93878.1 hemolysin D [Pseudoalteromonas sp. H71]TMN77835.1 efflux RND transporter periplasmic adaptor subunit [Pseudoalteromonas sp. S410]TMN92139.1 efflux RND transporter periplasmic adaptor subunit [Pseudoalteromonas sp. S408]TMN95598.1 efflux RND transporter periplasmic adaptor subunit [Pseudoalteromonas sp. S407]TMN98269.1 efflux RND transporter periplasmic adaptor subunit [Pseudoalteromon
MKTKTAKIIIPAAVVVAALLIVFFIKSNPPEARRFGSAPKAAISVSVLELVPQSYQVMIDSYGTVKPRTQSLLVAQASGQITEVSDEFREGGFFEKGDVLLKLDDRDHQAEVKSAQANLLTAEQSLLEEKARGQQALTDWKRLGGSSQASSLVLREPQLAAAQAQVLSAQATLEKAELDLERTKVTAPYAGRILSRSVDLGQVVSNNTQLATIYAIDSVEIRLPIKNKDLSFVNLPEQYRDGAKNQAGSLVKFSSDLVGEQTWQGQLARTEGAIDENAQQLYVVAKIDDPYKSTASNQYPIKIGQYIKAQIAGKTVQNALIIPNSTIYQGTYVYVVEGDVLKRKDVTFAWQNANQAMIKTGLKANDKLVVTPLGQVSSGTKVSILGAQPKEKVSKSKRPTREQLEQKAKELGISVEELIKKRRAAKQGDKA